MGGHRGSSAAEKADAAVAAGDGRESSWAPLEAGEAEVVRVLLVVVAVMAVAVRVEAVVMSGGDHLRPERYCDSGRHDSVDGRAE